MSQGAKSDVQFIGTRPISLAKMNLRVFEFAASVWPLCACDERVPQTNGMKESSDFDPCVHIDGRFR